MNRGINQEIKTETDLQQKVLRVWWLPKLTSFYIRIDILIYSDKKTMVTYQVFGRKELCK